LGSVISNAFRGEIAPDKKNWRIRGVFDQSKFIRMGNFKNCLFVQLILEEKSYTTDLWQNTASLFGKVFDQTYLKSKSNLRTSGGRKLFKQVPPEDQSLIFSVVITVGNNPAAFL
jgi:hypothetical protein